jgi:fructose-specific phosphotransferase system component IIB
MKKFLVVIVLMVLLVGGGAWYLLSGAGSFIRVQIEQQGTKFLGTSVSVLAVDVAYADARMTITDVDVENPEGFSKSDAFSLGSITLDLGDILNEPYTVQTVTLNAPEVLYEVDAKGQGNLIVLKNNLMANLPTSDAKPEPTTGSNPLVIVENVTVSDVRLKLDFEQLPTGDLNIEKKVYEVTLPTFNAGSIGKPSGIPADQVGLAIANAMLDNVIAQAKAEIKKRLEEEAKRKLKEKVDKEKDELLKKAGDKLKGLLGE